MAEMVITFDTVAKSLSVTLDGAEVPDVVGVEVSQSYRDDDQFCCCVRTRSEDESSGLTRMTHLVAKESAGDDGTLPESAVAGFVEKAGRQPVHADVLDYFAR